MVDTFIISNIDYLIELDLYCEILEVYPTAGTKKRVQCGIKLISFVYKTLFITYNINDKKISKICS